MTKLPSPDPKLHLILSDSGDTAVREAIQHGIREFNNNHSSPHRAARQPGGIRPLDILVQDKDGCLLGGLTGDTFWDWLEVDYIWLPEALRGQGLGTVLLAAAENEARRRGCRHVHLKTFGFQARGFYEKQGYHVVGELGDYPPGSSFYWLRKDLDE